MITEAMLRPFGNVLCHEPLKNHTTYQIGGVADFFIHVYSPRDLQDLIALLNRTNTDWLVLGNGSNVLIHDAPFHGVVISLRPYFNDFSFHDGLLEAQAGCSLIGLSQEALKRSLSGLEFAAGIPGSIGGGIYMNAGAYLSDLSNLLQDVTILKDGQIVTLPAKDLDFTYRHSIFQSHKDWIILSAHFQLVESNYQKIKSLMDSRKKRRMASQPLSSPCAGSVFRNPPEGYAWKIIEALGLRGVRRGGARISEIHANFIVNEKNATAEDVDSLIRLVQDAAFQRFGVRLITEVERINWHAKEKYVSQE